MRRLVTQITGDDPERVATALTVAVAAAAAGYPVHLWLSGPAAMIAVPGQEPAYDLEHAPDRDEALDAMMSVSVCSQCAQRRGLSEDDLRAGVKIAGATTLVEMLMADGTQALTY